MSKELDIVAERFSSFDGFNSKMSDYAFEAMKPHFVGRSCLELGCCDGKMTSKLSGVFDTVLAVDGSQIQIDRLKSTCNTENVHVLVSLLEELSVPKGIVKGDRFDTVVMSYVLEHVDDPVLCLLNAKRHLSTDGRILVVVPNGNSLHRQIGVEMGEIEYLTAFSPADIHAGHKRTYVHVSLKDDVEAAGLEVVKSSGIFLKILSAGQLESFENARLLDALFRLGCRYPEMCSSIMMEAK